MNRRYGPGILGAVGWYKTDIFPLMSAFREMELTMEAIKALVLVLIGVQRANSSGTFVQEALAKVFSPWTPYSNVRTIQLLNQLCNESQKEDDVKKDACYGCFFRASNQPPGYIMLIAMSTCANTYLNNTDYGHCQSYLKNSTTSISPRTNANVIYCSFIECIRQVNKDMLIHQCVSEAVKMFSTFNCTDDQLSKLFINATACVLAKTRCSYLNPITGAVQEDGLASKLNTISVNALQVNSDYDLNIIKVPFVHSIKGDECGKFRNVDQASWPSVEC